ncbi:hypothetical protein B5M09_009289 [Aphanomyces astaci]|uniref:FYVE-type domain-containing protein n=1 Tax=Aphanomyces astaci TaxID=112090 RepID=A0A3R7X233_APHAT|nr:hypothetical protein B5M09_009289 [Aphanomyces astaci]
MSGSNPRSSSSSAAARSPTNRAKKTAAFAQECAISFAKECTESTKGPSSSSNPQGNHRGKDSHVVHDYVSETKQYFVRATLELHAPLSEILELFAPTDLDDSDPFFSRLFDRAIDVSTVARHLGDGGTLLPPSNQMPTDDEPRPLTKGPVARSTVIKRIRFHDKKQWQKDLLCLEHVEPLSATSVVRFYESVDSWSDIRLSSTDSWTKESSGSTTLSAPHHENLTFGFLFEKISRANRLRLTFLGYHTTATRGDETCLWLGKVATSLAMVKNVVLRRRLTQDSAVVPSSQLVHATSMPPPSSSSLNFTATLPRACHTCNKSFHLFRRAHFCQVCQAAMCSKCTRHQDVESAPGLVVSMQVCHGCQVTLVHRNALNPAPSAECDNVCPKPHRSRLHNHRRSSSRRALSHRDALRSNPDGDDNSNATDVYEDNLAFDAQTRFPGVTMVVPPISAKKPASASATPRPTPRQATKASAAKEICMRCCASVAVGVCGACTMPFCGGCSVLQNVQVGPANVFELQLCLGCVAETAVPVTSPPSAPSHPSPTERSPPPPTVEPIVLRERPSFNPDVDAMMRTMTLRPQLSPSPWTPMASKDHSRQPQRYVVPLLEMEAANIEEGDEDEGSDDEYHHRRHRYRTSTSDSTTTLQQQQQDHPYDIADNQSSSPRPRRSNSSHVSSRASSNDSSHVGGHGHEDDHDATSLEDQLQMFACLDVGANSLHDVLCEEVCADMECANGYVTLIYQGATVLKGAFGSTAPSQIPSTCALVREILASSDTALLLVPDATADPRFASSPRVTGSEGIRFFCGFPLRTSDGHVLGTVSVADTAPRLRMSPQHRQAMETFHDNVVALIEDRLAVALQAH